MPVKRYDGTNWVTVAGDGAQGPTGPAGASATTVVTTKGDLLSYSTTAARLGVGANDTVLTADSSTATGLKWATPAAGGMTLISTTTLSGASITLSSIPSTYVNLYCVVRLFLPATDNSGFSIRFNGDSGTRYNTTANNGATAFSNTTIPLVNGNDNAVTQSLIAFEVLDYSNTSTWKMMRSVSIVNDNTTPTDYKAIALSGFYNQTAAISSITLLPASGNFTSGTALLYGVK
jgi:hypothetical protein